MSRTRRDILDTESMLERLTDTLREYAVSNPDGCYPRADAESLRRISMTLHRWHELECNFDIVRGKTTRKDGIRGFVYDDAGGTYIARQGERGEGNHFQHIPDREKGALARLAKIAKRYPSLSFYVQGDPRGCALYVLRPGGVPEGESADSFYSRGLAVHQ